MSPETAAAILGIGIDADKTELEKAYRLLARATHPDRFVGADATATAEAASKFAQATQAHAILSDRIAVRANGGAHIRSHSRAGTVTVAATTESIPMSGSVMAGWIAVLALAVVLSVTGGAAPLGPLEVSIRMALVVYFAISFALTGKRFFFVGLTALAAITALLTFFSASFWSLVALMTFLAPVIALALAGRRRAELIHRVTVQSPVDNTDVPEKSSRNNRNYARGPIDNHP
jgi:hypothetical protein